MRHLSFPRYPISLNDDPMQTCTLGNDLGWSKHQRLKRTIAACGRKEQRGRPLKRIEKSSGKTGTPRRMVVHWTVWSVYISVICIEIYWSMHSTSVTHQIHMGFQRCLSLSLSLIVSLSVSLPLFPSHVPVSLASRGYFDWGQTLGFHTIYNAALSNGIEYERGWNEHMLAKMAIEYAREKNWNAYTVRWPSWKSERKISKIGFIYIYIYMKSGHREFDQSSEK